MFGPKPTFLSFAISGVACLAAYIITNTFCLRKRKERDTADIGK